MQVAVDARYLCGLHRSMSLFNGNLLRALVDLQLGTPPIALIPRELHPSAHILRDELGGTVEWLRSDREIGGISTLAGELRWVHREIPSLLARRAPKADMIIMPYHHPPVRVPGVLKVVVVHDICGLGVGFPKYKKNYWRHYLRLWAAAHLADCIWPISQTTRDEMAARFPTARRRLGPVVYNGVERKPAPADDVEAVLAVHGLEPESYIVAFATWQKRKNFAASLAAMTLLRRQGKPIRLVGVAPENEREGILERCVAEGHHDAVILSNISDSQLDALYAGALALVWPSTCEGFGYPVVEAMAQGCPPLVWEVGPGAELVKGAIEPLASLDPMSIADRVMAIQSLRADDRNRLRETLRARASDFSPEAYQHQLQRALADAERRQ